MSESLAVVFAKVWKFTHTHTPHSRKEPFNDNPVFELRHGSTCSRICTGVLSKLHGVLAHSDEYILTITRTLNSKPYIDRSLNPKFRDSPLTLSCSVPALRRAATVTLTSAATSNACSATSPSLCPLLLLLCAQVEIQEEGASGLVTRRHRSQAKGSLLRLGLDVGDSKMQRETSRTWDNDEDDHSARAGE